MQQTASKSSVKSYASVAENSRSQKATLRDSSPGEQRCIGCDVITSSASSHRPINRSRLAAKTVAAIAYWRPFREISGDLKTPVK